MNRPMKKPMLLDLHHVIVPEYCSEAAASYNNCAFETRRSSEESSFDGGVEHRPLCANRSLEQMFHLYIKSPCDDAVLNFENLGNVDLVPYLQDSTIRSSPAVYMNQQQQQRLANDPVVPNCSIAKSIKLEPDLDRLPLDAAVALAETTKCGRKIDRRPSSAPVDNLDAENNLHPYMFGRCESNQRSDRSEYSGSSCSSADYTFDDAKRSTYVTQTSTTVSIPNDTSAVCVDISGNDSATPCESYCPSSKTGASLRGPNSSSMLFHKFIIDGNYWTKRARNNVAVRRSREKARRVREAISVENAELRFENERLKKCLSEALRNVEEYKRKNDYLLSLLSKCSTDEGNEYC